jgi:hypothetical protein
MTIGRLIRAGMLLFGAEILANGGSNVVPVGLGHRSGRAGVDAFEGEGFEAVFTGLVFLDEGLDVVAGAGVVAGSNLLLKIVGEVVVEVNGEGGHGYMYSCMSSKGASKSSAMLNMPFMVPA